MTLTPRRPSRAENNRDRLVQEVTREAERMRRLNANIEDSLYRRIKIKAAEEGRTIAEITRELWIEYLGK